MLTFPVFLTLLFFAVLLAIACWGMKQTSDVHDFFLGGKTLGPWILAFSYGTAYFSAVIFVGFAGKFGWQFGLDALWVGIANAVIGAGLAWLVLGKRTRTMTHNLAARTMPEFFAARFETNGMKILSALIIFIFLVPYSASVFTGLSHLFEMGFGKIVDFKCILTIISLVAFLYITFGGYKAVARIDFMLGVIMFAGSLLMVYTLARQFGGFSTAANGVSTMLAERLQGGDIKAAPWFVLPSVVFMTSFGVWGLPQMVHKYYAIRDEKEIWRGAIISTIFALVIGCAAYFTGAMSHLVDFPLLPKTASGGVDFDQLVPRLLQLHLHSQILLSLILLLVLSASLSTLSSLVLVSSSAVTIDLYKGYINPKADARHELNLMRVLCGVFILASYIIALLKPAWIFSLMSISWGAVAGSFLAPYLYGLFWKRTTKMGAYAGMISGLLLANGWYWYWFIEEESKAGAQAPVAACLAMIVPMLVVPIVSLWTKPPKEETIKAAFGTV